MNDLSTEVERIARELSAEMDASSRRLTLAIIVSNATAALLAGALGFVAGSLP